MNFRHLFNSILSYGAKPLINLVASVYLMTRYGPDDFGVAGLYIAFYSLSGIALELGYSNVILKSKEPQLIITCFLRVAVVSLLYVVLSFSVLSLFEFDFQVAGLWYYPLYAAFFAFNMLARNFWISKKSFNRVYTAEILPVICLISLLALGVVDFYLPHYFLVLIGLNSLVYFLFMSLRFLQSSGLKLRMEKTGKENFSYLGQNLINFFTRYFEKQTIFGLYGSEALGYSNRMQSVVYMPITMLASGLNGYFLPRVGEEGNKGKQLILPITGVLLVLELGTVFFPSVTSFLIESYLENWQGFVPYLKVFAPLIFLTGTYYVINIILVINKKVRFQNWFDLSFVACFFILLFVMNWEEFRTFLICWQVLWCARVFAMLGLTRKELNMKLAAFIVILSAFNLYMSAFYG